MLNRDQPLKRDQTNSFIDLHAHTTASDGTFSPTELVKYALSQKLVAIAITDHDSVGGIEEGLRAAKAAGLELVPGIEFSTEVGSESIHIVGLFVDHKNEELLRLTKEICGARESRARKIIEKINSLAIGPEITFREVELKARELIGRPHIGEVMIEKGYGKTMDEIFEKYLKRGAPGYVPRFKLTPKEGITLLRRIAAVPILAHPGLFSEEFPLEEFINEHIKYGLAGLEVEYPTHSSEQKIYFKRLTEKYDLVESGGSDCHGHLNNGPVLGSLKIPYTVLQKIKTRFNKE